MRLNRSAPSIAAILWMAIALHAAAADVAASPPATATVKPPTREAKLAMLQALGSIAEQERLCGATPERLRADKAADIAELQRAAPDPVLTPAEIEHAWSSGAQQGRQLVASVHSRDEWCRNFLVGTAPH
jgi:hypothetical protein